VRDIRWVFEGGVDGREKEEVYNCTIPMHERSSISSRLYL